MYVCFKFQGEVICSTLQQENGVGWSEREMESNRQRKKGNHPFILSIYNWPCLSLALNPRMCFTKSL